MTSFSTSSETQHPALRRGMIPIDGHHSHYFVSNNSVSLSSASSSNQSVSSCGFSRSSSSSSPKVLLPLWSLSCASFADDLHQEGSPTNLRHISLNSHSNAAQVALKLRSCSPTDQGRLRYVRPIDVWKKNVSATSSMDWDDY